MRDREIEKLDWILDRLIEFGGFVSSNDLHIYGLYSEYKDNQNKIDQDFSLLQSEFFRAGAAEKLSTQDAELICYNVGTLEFKNKHNSFKNYYIEKAKEKNAGDLEKKDNETIEKRKNAMVNHNYWYVRPKNIIGIILLFLAFVFGISNLKDLKDYFPKEKETEQPTYQESNQQDIGQTKEKKPLESQKTKTDSTEIKTEQRVSE